MNEQAPASGCAGIDRKAAWLRMAGLILTAGYLVAAAALLAWGTWKRFQLPQTPLIDPDIEGYLAPAISALAGKPFLHLLGRSFLYPGFVYLILRIFGDFRAIAVTQHVLGVAAGALLLLAWNAAGALVPAPAIPKQVFRWLGLAPAYVFLGSATSIFYEHQIRPEAIFPFLTILNIYVSFRFLEARFIRTRPAFVWLGALNVFLSLLIYLVKPSFGFATLFCTLPVWVSLLLPGAGIRQKAALAGAPLLAAMLLLFVPEHILKAHDPWGPLFLPETLLTVHAALIEQQMGEDLAGNGPLPYSRYIVEAAHDLLGAELEIAATITTPKSFDSLGYNPDYLMYENSFCTKFSQEMRFSNRAMADFCMTYYLRALRHHPGAMAAKVKRQLAIFYTPTNPVYWAGKSMDVLGFYYGRAGSVIALTSQFGPGNPAVTRYLESCGRLATEDIAIPQARRFLEWLRFFSAHYLHLLAVAALSPLLLFFRPLRAHFLWLVVATLLTYSYNFGNCLTIAVVHSLEVTRYVRIQLIFTVLAQCLSLYLLLELGVFGIRAGLGRAGWGWTAKPDEQEQGDSRTNSGGP